MECGAGRGEEGVNKQFPERLVKVKVKNILFHQEALTVKTNCQSKLTFSIVPPPSSFPNIHL